MNISSRDTIWKNTTAMKILHLFLDNPTQTFYEREIVRKSKLSVGAVNKYAKVLAKEKYLFLEHRGRMNFYTLDRENPKIKELKRTYNLTKPILNELKQVLEAIETKAYLFGSRSRGEDTEKSDWDILVITSRSLAEVEKAVSKIRKGKEQIKLSIYTSSDWFKMSKKDPAFFERVERDKIELI